MKKINLDMVVRFDRNDNLKTYLSEVRNSKGNLIEDNLKLVVSIALRYKWAMPLEDLIQEGNIGLVKAAQAYNPSIGAFSTFAVMEIRKAILAAIESDGRLVRRPHHAQDEWSLNDSLDEPITDSEGESCTRMDFLTSDMGIDDNLDTMSVMIGSLLDRLTEREKNIVVLYYGIGTDVPMGYSAIGMKLGMSDERARQLHLAALSKMRG